MFLRRFQALAEKVYLKGHEIKLDRDDSEPGKLALTFRVDFGSLEHLATDLTTDKDFDQSDLSKRLDDTKQVQVKLQQDLLHLLTKSFGKPPKKLKVQVTPDTLDRKTVRRYGYEVSVDCDLPKLEHLQGEIRQHLAHTFEHLALDLAPGMMGQVIEPFHGKVEGVSDGARVLMQALYRCCGNKVYMRDIEALLKRVDLTPTEQDALARLGRDLDQHHQG